MSKKLKEVVSYVVDDGDGQSSSGGGAIAQFLPAASGSVVTGGSIIADPATMRSLVKKEWEFRVDQNIRTETEKRNAAAQTLKSLQETLQLAKDAIRVPDELRRDAEAVTVALQRFEPDAVTLMADRRSLSTPLVRDPGISFKDDLKTYTAELLIRGGGHDVYTPRRRYDTPANVLTAFAAVLEGEKTLNAIDARLRELAKTRQTAGDVAETVFAGAAADALRRTPEGQDALNTMGKFVDALQNRAGLSETGAEGSLLALTGMSEPKPVTTTPKPSAKSGKTKAS